MPRQDRIKIIDEIEKHRNSKVFCYLTSDRPNISVQVSKDILPIFVNQLKINNSYDKIDLFIFTLGGDTLAGFGLARLLREYTDHVSTLIPDKCYSAGTLSALGSNEIIMTKGATLSPIDPSITRPLNPAVQLNPTQNPQLIPLSVESVAGFQSLAYEEWKISGKRELTKIFLSLAEKVHPLALGDVYRVRQQIELLASQLLKQHRCDKKNIIKIVNKLSKELGSHDYLIYRKEAIEILGKQITIDPKTEELVWNLFLDFKAEMDLGNIFDPSIILAQTQPPIRNGNPVQRAQNVDLTLAIIENKDEGEKAVKRINLIENLIPQANGQFIRNINQEIISSGWQRY